MAIDKYLPKLLTGFKEENNKVVKNFRRKPHDQ